jgi:hypothetical protein
VSATPLNVATTIGEENTGKLSVRPNSPRIFCAVGVLEGNANP